MSRLLAIVVFLLSLGCASSPSSYEAKNVDSPMPDELLTLESYEGQWEIQKCMNSKQAELVEFKANNEGLQLKRWQWKKDTLPLFEVDIIPEKQKVVTYQSKDMHDFNPVLNHTTWTWSDNRVVGTFQWQPDKGDQRGNWSGVAMAQFYIKKSEPNKLYWNRWGTSHTDERGLAQWKSSCVYSKVPGPKVVQVKDLDKEQMDKIKALPLIEQDGFESTDVAREKDPDKANQRDMMFLRKSQGLSNDTATE
ncbi:MAG: hypothetical protein HRT44_01860 [Bdellovibrionales bacterium]|nr:hypothetical protein [Bdellovibrionales bacterium]NQZ17992.1 hypothetical protein [Bdellovibrionales bacterium]